jgi:hypothetical protein
MLCALTVRKLKPGKFEDFMEAMIPPEGVEVPAGWKRFHALRNVADENEVITFGFFDGTLDELRASQEQQAEGGGYEERRAATEELVESLGADGIFEIVEERSMDG